MAEIRLVLEFASIDALAEELESNLRRGGAFVADATGLEETQSCELELVHPADGASLVFPARVVFVSPDPARPGVGLAIEGFSPELRAELVAFVEAHGEPPAAADDAPPARLHERVRGLSMTEQVKMAREGDLSERVLLERTYGKAVWESLLRNPRLTPPEVARLARMGTLPAPLLEQIASNGSWLQSAQVRRALLTNRRLGGDLVAKVLRATPKAELRLMPQQTAYPQTVRQAAKRLLLG